MLTACRKLGGCPTGEARITEGYALPARYVIHAVGPRWKGGARGEPEQLRGCYLNALDLAAEHDVRSIAFPSISTGIYGYPIEMAAAIAVGTVTERLSDSGSIDLVRFVCFSQTDLDIYDGVLSAN